MTASTQAFLTIEKVKDDLVLLKNGNVSMVLETTALNFDLLSPREQDAKIYAFAGLLNSLNFRIQVVVRTQPVDLTNYIIQLEAHKKKNIAPALARQMTIYIQFVKNLVVKNEVLDKRFFIVIPYSSVDVHRTSVLKKIFGKDDKIVNADKIIERAKTKLYPRRDHVIKQLARMNLNARQLSNDELTSLFYSIYNPGQSQFRKLKIKPSDLSAPMITSTPKANAG